MARFHFRYAVLVLAAIFPHYKSSLVSQTSYFLDNSLQQCNTEQLVQLDYVHNTAVIRSRRLGQSNHSSSTSIGYTNRCVLSFKTSDNTSDDLMLGFDQASTNYIEDCSVTLALFAGPSDAGAPQQTYNCYASFATAYPTVYDGSHLTVVLVTKPKSWDYEFTIYVTPFPNRPKTLLEELAFIGIVLGVILIICLVFGFCFRKLHIKHRQKLARLQQRANDPQATTAGFGMGQQYVHIPPPLQPATAAGTQPDNMPMMPLAPPPYTQSTSGYTPSPSAPPAAGYPAEKLPLQY